MRYAAHILGRESRLTLMWFFQSFAFQKLGITIRLDPNFVYMILINEWKNMKDTFLYLFFFYAIVLKDSSDKKIYDLELSNHFKA